MQQSCFLLEQKRAGMWKREAVLSQQKWFLVLMGGTSHGLIPLFTGLIIGLLIFMDLSSQPIALV
jgi:hypothetical protein